mmetsp:Transcript_5828/g.10103  ORF Transcript_5828/g.10103 Transcript_5828/m.10103 type:complete len:147 (-) Transcript_5828:302-742(-)
MYEGTLQIRFRMVAISTVAKTKNLVRKKVALWKTVFVAPRSPAIWRWIEFPTSYMVNRGFLCCTCGGRKVLFKEVSIFVRLSFFALCSNNRAADKTHFPAQAPKRLCIDARQRRQVIFQSNPCFVSIVELHFRGILQFNPRRSVLC